MRTPALWGGTEWCSTLKATTTLVVAIDSRHQTVFIKWLGTQADHPKIGGAKNRTASPGLFADELTAAFDLAWLRLLPCVSPPHELNRRAR